MSGWKGRDRWGVPENLIAAPRWLETGYAWIFNPPTRYVRGPWLYFLEITAVILVHHPCFEVYFQKPFNDICCNFYFIPSFSFEGAFIPRLILVLNRNRRIKLTRLVPSIRNLHHSKLPQFVSGAIPKITLQFPALTSRLHYCIFSYNWWLFLRFYTLNFLSMGRLKYPLFLAQLLQCLRIIYFFLFFPILMCKKQ